MTIVQKQELNTEKPSITIRQAVADLEVMEVRKDTRIDMDYYYLEEAEGDTVCSVCFAGAVMHNRFEGLYNLVDTYNVGIAVENMRLTNVLSALNQLRMYRFAGFFKDYFDYRGIGVDPRLHSGLVADLNREVDTTRYYEDPEEFKKNMLQIADICERHGI